jgi:hypothetical protein
MKKKKSSDPQIPELPLIIIIFAAPFFLIITAIMAVAWIFDGIGSFND